MAGLLGVRVLDNIGRGFVDGKLNFPNRVFVETCRARLLDARPAGSLGARERPRALVRLGGDDGRPERGLGPERFGLYTLAFVYVSFFATVIDNGLNIVVTRAISTLIVNTFAVITPRS